MQSNVPMQRVKLLKRYKRFLADVELSTGEVITVHTPNTGSMMGCAEPDSYVWIRNTENPKRKYLWSWWISESQDGELIGVDTGLANQLVADAIGAGLIRELVGYQAIKKEVKYGEENSRIDILLKADSKLPCYVEVKNVTAKMGDYAVFPDAVTIRGAKHLRELVKMKEAGHRAVIFFCVQRGDVQAFRPAIEIDVLYAEEFNRAISAGVETLAYKADVNPYYIKLSERIPVNLHG